MNDVEEASEGAGEDADLGSVIQVQLQPDGLEHLRDHVAVGDAQRVHERTSG